MTHPDDLPRAGEAFVVAVQNPGVTQAVELRLRHRDGSWRIVEAIGERLLQDSAGADLVVTVRDITERRQAEEVRLRLATAVEQAAESVIITDSDGTIQYVNPAFERISGYTREEAIGQNPRFLKSGKHDAVFYRQMWDALLRGEVWTGHFINKKKDGSLSDEEATISPLRDASGKIIGYVSVQRDVAREVTLEAQLRQAQKMEAVGRLAGGVAHDFNNLLTAILGYSELLLLQFGANNPLRQKVLEIQQAAERAATLTRQLLAFSRRQVLQPQVLDLNTLVANLEKLLRRLIGEDISLVTGLVPQLGRVKADPGQLEQVIMNLVVNARDAMPQGGKLTIETANVELDETNAYQVAGARLGPYVLLAVSDTGIGMTEEVKAHLFEPFFTTKEEGKGTGLGLAIVYGIVTQSGGCIQVYSEPGHGTTFKIYLPRVEEIASESSQRKAAGQLPWGTETILLVEDERVVRELAVHLLQELGYTVLEAASGTEALRLTQEQAGKEIHLLVTDMVMPQMGGMELVDRFRALCPRAKVLFISGYAGGAMVHHGVLEGGGAFLQKPFTFLGLARKVREVLDA